MMIASIHHVFYLIGLFLAGLVLASLFVLFLSKLTLLLICEVYLLHSAFFLVLKRLRTLTPATLLKLRLRFTFLIILNVLLQLVIRLYLPLHRLEHLLNTLSVVRTAVVGVLIRDI